MQTYNSYFGIEIIQQPRFQLNLFFNFEHMLNYCKQHKHNDQTLAKSLSQTIVSQIQTLCNTIKMEQVKKIAGIPAYVEFLFDDELTLNDYSDLDIIQEQKLIHTKALEEYFELYHCNIEQTAQHILKQYYGHLRFVNQNHLPKEISDQSIYLQTNNTVTPQTAEKATSKKLTIIKLLTDIKNLYGPFIHFVTGAWLKKNLDNLTTPDPPPPKPWFDTSEIDFNGINFHF